MSEKKLQDYLPYYIGCNMIYSSHHEPQNEPYILTFKNIEEAIEFGDRPILRKLEDVSQEEAKYIIDNYTFGDISIPADEVKFSINITKRLSSNMKIADYLLKQHFDLFGLIDSGLAIDASTTYLK